MGTQIFYLLLYCSPALIVLYILFVHPPFKTLSGHIALSIRIRRICKKRGLVYTHRRSFLTARLFESRSTPDFTVETADKILRVRYVFRFYYKYFTLQFTGDDAYSISTLLRFRVVAKSDHRGRMVTSSEPFDGDAPAMYEGDGFGHTAARKETVDIYLVYPAFDDLRIVRNNRSEAAAFGERIKRRYVHGRTSFLRLLDGEKAVRFAAANGKR
ncbi:MAG: hypothetical protein E7655_07655 [Ruminococcaceae bacterium]|nr:hypothetical protein [Oscillospiraceae bacterium]